ncbi:MAG TPA: metallophosphoesterase [Verrucomicrobiales bacterium]|nr:metallophosphoesterase [Verrucomicrobiales bacterium]HIL71515.1 metallophosphoesterase [Verrucomicrobiota bacterium]
MTRIGIISDTHGLLRAEVKPFLQSCDHILHAGDFGDEAIYKELCSISQLTSVRGNIDYELWTMKLPHKERIVIENKTFFILHNIEHLDIDPVAAGIDVVVSGHTHRPELVTKKGVQYLNPGSIGPERQSLPITYAEVIISGEEFTIDFREVN